MSFRSQIASIPGAKATYRWLQRISDRDSGFLYELDSAVGSSKFLDIANRKSEARTGDLVSDLQLLKAVNLLVNKHEYRLFAVRKVGRPSGFMLDTANACQLGCPSCQHSSNKEWAQLTYKKMQPGTMKPDTFEKFIRQVGLWSYNGHFYNNSEPFLNKRTPDYIRRANLYRVKTLVSSNMSLPKLDAEAIVESGLNTLMTAIDGATQGSYERYRRGGNLELVLENAAAIVAAKKRLGSDTPTLRWQFLTFEHNVAEIPAAMKLARKIGYDIFNSATPYDVSMDAPGVKAVTRSEILEIFKAPDRDLWTQPLESIAEEIDSAFDERLEGIYEPATPKHGHCDWLQLAVVGDALGSIRPCCIPDYHTHGQCEFSSVEGDIFNGTGYLDSRAYFAGGDGGGKCHGCDNRPLPQVGLGSAYTYFITSGLPYSAAMRYVLTGWSKHG